MWDQLRANARVEFLMLAQGDSHEALQRKFLQGAGLTTEMDNYVFNAQIGIYSLAHIVVLRSAALGP